MDNLSTHRKMKKFGKELLRFAESTHSNTTWAVEKEEILKM
jgi:hypothetical protein